MNPRSALPGLARAGLLALPLCLLVACGSWGRVGDTPKPKPGETLTQILDLNTVFKRLGRLTAGAPLPFVADVAFFGGPADSTLAVVAASLENRDLAFQRDADAFVARYRVQLTAQPAGGGSPVVVAKDQTVRVLTFAETQRSEESVLYQEGLTLAPGSYTISVELRDLGAQQASRAEGNYQVPRLGAGSYSSAVLAYQVRGRGTRAAPMAIILNPRGTLAFGSDSASLFVEGYGLSGPRAVPVTMVDAQDSLVRVDTLHFTGGKEVEGLVLRFSPDSAPLGQLRIVLGTGADTVSTTALVSFSTNWVVTNYEDMLNLLRYYPPTPALDSLRKAPPADRSRLWRAFWRATDPNPGTSNNEALDLYFRRVALANQRFRDEGQPGWRTDRGEVLIRLGDPDEVFDASPQSEGRLIRWGYTQYQLALYFVDETGFGRFRLTPSSRAELERIIARLGRQGD
jgi:GWxTD domain-containing protein